MIFMVGGARTGKTTALFKSAYGLNGRGFRVLVVTFSQIRIRQLMAEFQGWLRQEYQELPHAPCVEFRTWDEIVNPRRTQGIHPDRRADVAMIDDVDMILRSVVRPALKDRAHGVAMVTATGLIEEPPFRGLKGIAKMIDEAEAEKYRQYVMGDFHSETDPSTGREPT